jgi:feruloyl esterase
VKLPAAVIGAVGAACIVAACGGSGGEEQRAALACTALAGQKLPASYSTLATSGATIRQAELVLHGDPNNRNGEYCKVRGAIHPVDPQGLDIEFQVNLPTDWNKKALHFGGSGFNGILQTGLAHPESSLLYQEDWLGHSEITEAQRKGPPTPLKQGYVTFGSDSGHQAKTFWDASFGVNQEALDNFAGDQMKKVKDLALVQRRYGTGPQQVYFAGGSEGGREALVIVQRYPAEYDGLIAVYPVINWVPKALHDNGMVRALYADGGVNWIDPDENRLINKVVKDTCDGLDNLVDGIVSNIAACATKEAEILATLRCPGGTDAGSACLSAGEIAVVRAFNTPRQFDFPLANNFTSMPGYSQLVGADLGILFGSRPVPSVPPSLEHDGLMGVFADNAIRFQIVKNAQLDTFTWEPRNHAQEILAASQLLDAMSTDLAAFQRNGGKLIIIHGTEDEMVTPYGTIDYYQQLVARYGAGALGEFVKFYLVPGFSHGAGTFYSRIESVKALDAWVAQGVEPQTLVAEDQNPANGGRTRPVCHWPAYPSYKGQGDASNWQNFECRMQ